MNHYPAPQNCNQTKNTQRNGAQVISCAINNSMHIDHNILGLLINIVVIIVLLLSRKSWGG